MILQAILGAIALGVHLMRSHFRPDPMTTAEVDALLMKAAKLTPEATDWHVSIVDLMKVLRLDSSITVRRALAVELGYEGEPNGSAEMNNWLHREVMKRVAEHKIG